MGRVPDGPGGPHRRVFRAERARGHQDVPAQDRRRSAAHQRGQCRLHCAPRRGYLRRRRRQYKGGGEAGRRLGD